MRTTLLVALCLVIAVAIVDSRRFGRRFGRRFRGRRFLKPTRFNPFRLFRRSRNCGRRQPPPPPVCHVDGQTLQEGASTINQQCKRVTCRGGRVIPACRPTFSCPQDTQCSNGRCVCRSGYQAYGTTENGKVDRCRKTPTCCRLRGKTYKEGSYVLVGSCKQKQRCEKGNWKTVDRRFCCPSGTTCNRAGTACTCKPGYEKIGDTLDGSIEKCRKIPTDCKFNGRTVKEGTNVLSSNCDAKQKCARGVWISTTRHFACPTGTRCNGNGKCVCAAGYKKKGNTFYGLIYTCEKTQPPGCEFKGRHLKKGGFFMTDNCDSVTECVADGQPLTDPYNCPVYSKCNGAGRCVCEEGTREIGEELDGLVKTCQCYCEDDFHLGG